MFTEKGQSAQVNNAKRRKESYPIHSSDEHIKKNSMKLYLFLLSISRHPKNKDYRVFDQKDFSMYKVKNATGMDQKTAMKYWYMLEQSGLVICNDRQEIRDTSELSLEEWKPKFKARKLKENLQYQIIKEEPYRLVPKDTIQEMQTKYLISEIELKLYLKLLCAQEYHIENQTGAMNCTLRDLLDFVGYKPITKNYKTIAKAVYWLKAIGILNYELIPYKSKSNLRETFYYYSFSQINYYIDRSKNIFNKETMYSSVDKEKIINQQEDVLVEGF